MAITLIILAITLIVVAFFIWGWVNVVFVVFIVFILGMLLGLPAMTYYMALGPLRWYLGLGPQGGVDIAVTIVFSVFLFWMLSTVFNTTISYYPPISVVSLLALPVCLPGLLFLGVGLFEAPKRTGERRDRLFLGISLMATAFVIVYLDYEPFEWGDITSISGAPGP